MSLCWSRTHDVSLIRYSGLQPTSVNPGQSLLKGRRPSAFRAAGDDSDACFRPPKVVIIYHSARMYQGMLSRTVRCVPVQIRLRSIRVRGSPERRSGKFERSRNRRIEKRIHKTRGKWTQEDRILEATVVRYSRSSLRLLQRVRSSLSTTELGHRDLLVE